MIRAAGERSVVAPRHFLTPRNPMEPDRCDETAGPVITFLVWGALALACLGFWVVVAAWIA